MKSEFLTIYLLFFLFFSGNLQAGEDAKVVIDKADAIFEQATVESNAQQAQKLYLQAAALFEKATETVADNHKIYCNIGNCYYLASDMGRAILNYRKAEKLNPRSTEIQMNLSNARNKRLDKVEQTTEKRIISKIFFWHHDLRLKTRFYASIIFIGILLSFLAMRIVGIKIPGFLPISSILVFFVLCFGISTAISIIYSGRVEGVIVASDTVARKGDGQIYAPAFESPLHSGTEFVVVESREDWIKVLLSDKSEAWLQKKDCELF